MAHDHDHSHHGHHHHTVHAEEVNTAFIIGIILNFSFVVIEVIVGITINSLSLLSDAGHNLADVGTLALSLLAFRMMKIKSNERYTYGYRKTSVFVALINAVILLVSIGAIVFEAVHRIIKPEPLPGLTISIVAGIGIAVNGISAMLFMRNKEKDLNIKSAYLHLLSDAVVSLALVIGGIVIIYTGWYVIDSILSLVVAGVILTGTWNLLRDSLRLSLDAVPTGISIENIRNKALKIKGVKDLHHIHIWAISTTENALTAHLVLPQGTTNTEEQKIKHNLKHELEHNNIHHITLESEYGNESCEEDKC
ncbi:MAG TPA: cation diffusion facilitator family transporter [Bacteroidia bacterium]|nr:cation diffusion facilitator family transporter [Bacteroidia bacterium]